MIMTPRRKLILDFLWAERDAGRPCPTNQEIGDRFGFRSRQAVQANIADLEAMGYLKRKRGRRRTPARCIELLERSDGTRPGDIAARALQDIARTSTDPIAMARARTALIAMGVKVEALPSDLRVVAA